MKRLTYFLLITPAVLAIVWTIGRVSTVPENHIGFDPYFLLCGVPLALIGGAIGVGRSRIFALLIALLSASTIFFAVHFNFLLQYEDWVAHGMPSQGSFLRK